MAESFLEEQLRRIKQMTEQMSRVRTFRETDDVRDHPLDERNSAHDAPEPVRRLTRGGAPRRRSR